MKQHSAILKQCLVHKCTERIGSYISNESEEKLIPIYKSGLNLALSQFTCTFSNNKIFLIKQDLCILKLLLTGKRRVLFLCSGIIKLYQILVL